MQDFLKAIVDRLKNKAGLTDLATISVDQQPSEPKELKKVAIVIKLETGEDEMGYHGAALNPGFEIDLWGYYGKEATEIPKVLEVMDLVDSVFIRRLTLDETNNGGTTLRFRPLFGWQKIESTADVDSIHYRNQYITRYWSNNRIDAIRE